MNRLDHDCVWATAKTVLDMIGHLLPEEAAQREFFSRTVATIEACLLKRDTLRARERQRLCKPAEDDEGRAPAPDGPAPNVPDPSDI